MNAIFFGFKRCGKTTLGKAVAKRLDRPFIDTDELLGAPPSTLYHKMGEEKFRILEANVIRALPPLHHAIISVGGGAMINPNNVHILSRLGTLIYLKVDEIVLAERNCRKPLPAFLDPYNLEASFAAIYAKRSALYESIPAIHFDLSRKECDAAVFELCTMITKNTHGT